MEIPCESLVIQAFTHVRPQTVFKAQGHFPWDAAWPPRPGAGNYSDQSRREKAPLPNTSYLQSYHDGFPTSAPVMSFQPNKHGIYDLGSNVWEWCEDAFDHRHRDFPLRGSAWGFPDPTFFHSPFRNPHFYGFRVVLEPGEPKTK